MGKFKNIKNTKNGTYTIMNLPPFAENLDFGKRRQVQHDKFSRVLGHKAAFTLAETLIALAVIGIVAALTIPGIVKNYNEHAWSTAQDVFAKKLDVALKEMNTEGTLTGYRTTEAFVNELKKNIKITQICTDDVTKCFAKNVKVREYNGEVTLTNANAIECETGSGQDWAENVGIRFANGVNAIISYNKNCTSDPYNNQFSPSPACIGIIYDVSGNKKPNTIGKDIGANANVAKVGGKAFCAFEFKYKDNDPVCFTKILAPGEYNGLPIAKADGSKIYCSTVKDDLDISDCYYGEQEGDPSKSDYWAGAAYACGGTSKLPDYTQLVLLARYLFEGATIPDNYDFSYIYTTKEGIYLNKTRAEKFLKVPEPNNQFFIWSVEQSKKYAYARHFANTGTGWHYASNGFRYNDVVLTVCVE